MRIQILILGFKGLRASLHEPGWPGWPRLRVVPYFSSGRVEGAKRERAWKSPLARKGDTWLPGRISPLVPKEKRRKILGTSSGAKFEKQSKHGNDKNLNFCAYHSFGNSSSCITAVKWDAYDVENTAGNARRCHPDHQNSSCFHSGNLSKVFSIWQNF